jgi:hypothetical protein
MLAEITPRKKNLRDGLGGGRPIMDRSSMDLAPDDRGLRGVWEAKSL